MSDSADTLIDLPIVSVLSALRAALSEGKSAILSAPPGSGKTTLVPLKLLGESWLVGRKIVMLEPRRLAARAAAARMAQLLGEQVGETVGYRIRLDSKVTAKTRIEVVTEGILTRRLQQDPELRDVGLVVFDEFHERSLQADLGLALTLDVMAGLRDDLRLLLMSATLPQDRLRRMLDSAPLIQAEGRSYPVAIHYLGDPPVGSNLSVTTASATLQVLKQTTGDMLVFLPGVGEIHATKKLLLDHIVRADEEVLLCLLYGDLTKVEQDRAIMPDPQGRRRVVLTTSIAETSLTIEGVSTVLDSGWSRLPRFLPQSGLTRLETVRVSRAVAEQRAGRAGRMGPGQCFRLWSEHRHAGLAEFHPPEIVEADLSHLVLEIKRWGVSGPDDLRWLDPPPPGAYAQACDLLRVLGALNESGYLTGMGKTMADLSLHPRLAHMLLCAASRENRRYACDLAALIIEKDILKAAPGAYRDVDLEHRLNLLRSWREDRRTDTGMARLDQQACQQVDRISRQWLQSLPQVTPAKSGVDLTAAGLVAMAYPDRIAKQRRLGSFLLASGRGAWLPEDDGLAAADYLVVAQLDAGQRDGRIQLALRISEAELRQLPNLTVVSETAIIWDTEKQAVIATEEERLGAIVLTRKIVQSDDAVRTQEVMLRGIRQMGLGCLPWNKTSEQWRNRVLCLAQWQPAAGWPDLSDAWLAAHLEEWLAPWLNGISRAEQLRKLDMLNVLKARLDWRQQQLLDELAPVQYRMPGGNNRPLHYEPGSPPVLAVRLQELFGQVDSPSVCQGQVPVMLHLLSPANRPIQVTQDLQGFWQRTYIEVKKELKGRYPKHYWPDDPLQAEPRQLSRKRG